MLIEEVNEMLEINAYQKALDKLGSSDKNGLECDLLKVKAMEGLGKYQAALHIVNSGIEDILDNGIVNKCVLELFYKQIHLHLRIGKIPEAKTKFSEIKRFLNQNNTQLMQNNKYVADLYNKAGQLYGQLGQVEQSIENFNKSMEIWKSLDNRDKVMGIRNNIALIKNQSGDIEKAKNIFIEILNYYENSNNTKNVISVKNNLSYACNNLGEYLQSLKWGLEAYEEVKKINNKRLEMNITNNLGKVYSLMGEFHNAFKFYNTSLEIAIKLQNRQLMAICNQNIGSCYLELQKLEEAITYFRKAQAMLSELKMAQYYALNLESMCKCYIKMKQVDNAKIALDKLRNLKNDANNKIVSTIYKYTKGIYLKSVKSYENQILAKNLFQEIIDTDIVDYQFSILAMLDLAEICLEEYKITQNNQVFENLKGLLNKLVEIARQNNLSITLIKSLMIKFYLNIIEENYVKSKKYIEEALIIAREHGFLDLAILSSDYQDFLIPLVADYHKIIDQPHEIHSKSKQILELEKLLKFAKKGKLIDIEVGDDTPILFLIIHNEIENGQLFEINNTSSSIAEPDIDDIVTSVLHVSDLDKSKSVRQIFIKNHILLYKDVENLTFCVLINGKSFSALYKLDTLIELIKTNQSIWSKLNNQELLSVRDDIKKYIDQIYGIESEVSEPDNFDISDQRTIRNENLNNDFNIILHPVRFFIIKLLFKYYKIQRSTLQKMLDISSSSLHNHLKSLSNEELISTKYELLENNDKPYKIVYLNNKGYELYKKFRSEVDIDT